jgi:hypothetical protein
MNFNEKVKMECIMLKQLVKLKLFQVFKKYQWGKASNNELILLLLNLKQQLMMD